MQYAGGEFSHHDLIAIRLFQCGYQQPGLNGSAVDKEGLQVAAGAGVRGLGDIARQGILLPAAFYLYHFGALTAVDAVNRSLQSAGAGGPKSG